MRRHDCHLGDSHWIDLMEPIAFSTRLLAILILEGIVFIILLVAWLKYRSHRADMRAITSILESAAIPAYSHSLPQLRNELSRARRYKRPLSIIVIRPNGAFTSTAEALPKNNNHSSQLKRLSLIEFLLCGPILRDAVREIYITTYDGENNQFIVVLPETYKSQAVETVNRFRNIVGRTIASQMVFGISEFPTTGLIIADLVDLGMAACAQEIKDKYEAESKSKMVTSKVSYVNEAFE